MDFGASKMLIEVIREGVFGGTYFRDICSGVNKKSYKNSWKEFVHVKNIDVKFLHQIVLMWMWINMV